MMKQNENINANSTIDNHLFSSQQILFNEETRITEKLNKKFKNEKEKIFNKWIFFGVAANIVQILSSLICLFSRGFKVGLRETFVGFSCLMTCFHLCSYIEYSEKYSVIYKTINSVLPNIFRYLLGVLPLFLGYILFGNNTFLI